MNPRFGTDNGSRVSTYGNLLPAKNASPMPASTTTDLETPRLSWPSERHRLPTRCRHCTARLLLSPSDLPTATDPLHDVTCLLCSRVACQIKADGQRRIPSRELPIDPPTRIGRPPTRIGPVRPSGRPCVDCCEPVAADSRRCADCEGTRRLNEGVQGRLLAILEQGGEPLHHRELCDLLGVSHDSLRNAIRNARRRGYPILRSQGGRYSLDGVRP